MAQYKVPQDVEADDKLLGPFSFRQFVYLLICGGLIALAVGLFQIFPFLAIIPVPFVLFFAALALPLKKDQPMETYLAALISYYVKPRTRRWTPGQKESTIIITAPKVVEETRARDISGEEATHRLSFLANIVDTEGYAIKDVATNPVREELVAEANATTDMFETQHFDSLGDTIAKDENERHAEVMQEMRDAIEKTNNMGSTRVVMRNEPEKVAAPIRVDASIQAVSPNQAEVSAQKEDILKSDVVVMPGTPVVEKPVENSNKVVTNEVKPSIIELANNPDFSVATIAKEANRINRKDEGEVFISLH